MHRLELRRSPWNDAHGISTAVSKLSEIVDATRVRAEHDVVSTYCPIVSPNRSSPSPSSSSISSSTSSSLILKLSSPISSPKSSSSKSLNGAGGLEGGSDEGGSADPVGDEGGRPPAEEPTDGDLLLFDRCGWEEGGMEGGGD